MKGFILCLLSLSFITGFAQTKKIAFKSHSGSDANFSIALENNLFDMENSDFGLPSDENKRAMLLVTFNTKLDSVIFLADSAAVFISSDKTSSANNKVMRKDTLLGRALFSQKISVDSIKKGLKNEFQFNSPVDSVKFIGFDNGVKNKQKNNEFPVSGITTRNDSGPFDGQAFLIIGLIVFLSLAAGLLTWKYKPAQFS